MTLQELARVLLRRWWLILLVPAVLAPLLLIKARTQPFQSTLRAAILLPGDTEIPGNSERPELMVMDDLPSLIGSRAFADAVAAQLASTNSSFSSDDVLGSVSASRYSRIVTLTVTSGNAGKARTIANAAAAALPGVVNQFLVAPNTTPATVQIIDPPGDPTRNRPHERFIFVALLGLGAAMGAVLALLANTWPVSEPAGAPSTGPRSS